jgi:hypothetical protein
VIPDEDSFDFDIDQRIQICEVEKELDPDDRDWQLDAHCIEQALDKKLRALHREINRCHDNERIPDLWESYYADKARHEKIKRVLAI